MDRPRRSTRNSLYNSTPTTTTTPSTSNQNNTSNSNPYKKPTYLAGRSGGEAGTPTSSRRGRGGRGGRSSGAGGRHSNHDNGATPLSGNGSKSGGKSSRPECVATRVESRRSTGGSSGGGGGAASSKKKRGAYNSQDYHYGSDFSDQNDSELDEAGSGSESTSELGNDEADSDSDYSIKFSKATSSSSADAAVATTPPSRVPSPPVPLWMEADAVIEELDLPKSSDDLLLARDLVMKAVAIYEPLRRFHQLVRLSPFRFEDFCAALGNEETSPLLTEIHIQLLKTILREEEANAAMFGPAEVKDSIQAVLYFIDNLTWPECLRAYIESDPNWGEVLAEMVGSGSGGEYPFGGAEIRIKILSWMVDQFLATSLVRDVLVSENIRHDDYCRSCNKMGEVVMCETCPAVYHLYCMTPPYKGDDSIPDDWQCPVCKKSNVSGISDCASELEKAGLLIRHEKLGNDRHGRKYWFLVRRILAESEDGSSVWYYSTPLQVEELLYRLDEEGYEAELVENIRNCKEEIVRQMEVTEQITESSNSLLHRKTYIEAENAFLKKIHEDRELAHVRELENQAKEAERALEAAKQEEEAAAAEEEEVKQKEELEKKRIREERLLRRNQNKFVDYNPAEWNEDGTPKGGSSGSGEDSSGETGKMNHCNEDKSDLDDTKSDLLSASQIASAETQLIDSSSEDVTIPKLEPEVQTDEKMDTTENGPDDLFVLKKTDAKPAEVKKEDVVAPVSRRKSKALLLDWDTEERMTRLKATGLYKLGQEGNYRNYVNIYNTDNLALSKFQHGEESIKKRHMSHKFSLTAASEVKWNSFSSSVGLRTNMVSTLRATLVHLEGAVPITLMHTNWGAMRKAWVTAVAGCTGAKDFAKATITLAACLRSSIYNPVWTESLAHHKLIRTSALEREERKKAEKRDKKDRDDEEDRLRLLPQWVKYSIPAKHQVYKQKGEEYRIHGRWGWIWMSTGRRCKPQDCRKMGLLGGPYKHVIQVKNDSGKVKTILIDPTTFDKLMAKRTLSQKATPVTTPAKVVPPPPTEVPPPVPPPLAITAAGEEESKEEKIEKMEVDESPVKEEEEVKPEVKEEEKEDATMDPPPDKKSESSSSLPDEEKKCEELVVSPPQSDEVPPPSTETGMEIDPKIEEKPHHDQEECDPNLIPKDEPVDAPTAPEMEPLSAVEKVEIKEEKEDEAPPAPRLTTSTTPSSPSTSSSDALAASNRKFRTDLINVSLGMVVANRILYPKLAHKSAILDSLLARRISLQKLEEDNLMETYGKEKLDKVQQIVDAGGQIVEETKVEEPTVDEKGDEILDDSFPLAGIYRSKCYSYMCQKAAAAFATQTENKVRDYEYKCYSPMCRLKFFVQDSNRRKEERARVNEKAKLVALVEEVKGKKMFTQIDSSCKILLKKLPNELNRRRNQVIYPTTSKFCSVSTPLDPSIFVLPWHELRKLSRTAGRTFTPSGFAPAPKTGSWAWPYPCGRPLFKTGWQFKAVHSNTLAAAALQLRILWASVKWDDIQMKAPNYDGKNQITTDMEIITSEILLHRVVGRFMERVQYLRKKTVEPIDAPKTIREITPSRSGLRKRKLAESLQGSDPVVTESWVDEDQLELWEIKMYHEKVERKSDPASSSSKPGTPLGSTRSKSGVSIKQPEKFDPSPSSDGTKGDKTISPAKTAELMREKLETEEKMQRAVHLSKRDNHPKNNNNAANKQPTPTASQQLQQQQAAAGLPANPRSYGSAAPSTGKKVTIVAPKTLNVSGAGGADVSTTPGAGSTAAAVAILNRSKIGGVVGSSVAIPKVAVVQQTAQSPTTVTTPQKITVFRTSDGKLQVRGLLPGQAVYQTADGKIGLTSTTAASKIIQPGGQQAPQQHIISPQPQGQTILIQSQGVGTQLQQVSSSGSGGGNSPLAIQQSTVSSSQTTPLINISSPAMRTVLSSSPSAVKFISQQQNSPSTPSPLALTASGQLVHTYSAAGKGNIRKVNPKFPTAIAPTPAPVTSASQQVTGTLNAQGQIVLTRGGQVINQQIVIQPGPGAVVVSSSSSSPSPNVVGGGNVVAIKSSPIITQATTPTSASPPPQPQMLVTSSSSNSPLPPSQQITTPHGTTALLTYQAGGKIVIQDGSKTIVVTGGANLTTQQLQQILQMQAKKPSGTVMTTQPVSAQPGQQGLKPQQQVIVGGGQQQQQQQIVQGQGGQQQIQIISGGGAGTIAGQSLQQIAASGQGQLVLQGVQNLPSGHQIATLGGQNVIVKKVLKSPIKSGTPLTIQTPPGQPIPTAAQIQQLLAANKNLIRVDPATGTVNISSATFQQLQLQQQQQQNQQQSPMLGSTSSVGLGVAGSTTVTKTPGLPISIVSPSKNPKIVPSLFPQGNAAAVKTISSVTTPLVTPSTRYIAPAIVQQQQRLGAPQQMVSSPVLSTNSPPTAVKTTPGTPASVMQTPPSIPQSPSQQPKIAAQFIETEEGPRVIVSGFKPGDLTQSQLASLNAQIVKQMQEHPALREKFSHMTDPASELKIILQPHPPNIAGTPQKIVKVPPASPVKAASGLVKGAGASSPVRGVSPVKTSPVKSPVTSGSPMKGLPSSPSALIKSPPNSANIEAAIAAVASNSDAPVILPAKSSPVKKAAQSGLVASSSSPPTSLPTPSKEDMLKNILQKVEAENHHVISASPTKPGSPPRKKASPKKSVTPQQPEVALVEEEQGIPQPIEGDVVIDDGVVNEIEVSENNDAEVPRFVLSQDLMGSGQAGHKQLESSSASSMTFFSSPPHVQEHEIASTTNTVTSPNNKPKSGSSRRKSPVKTKNIMQNSESAMIMSPPKKRINMSPMASPKQVNLMHKQTDLLKKDISKKRVLLERDLIMDIREISQDDKGLLSDDVDTNPEQNARPGQGKRKASGSKSHGGGKRKKRNSSPGKNSVVKQRPKSGGNKVHCICKTPYDKTRFYICCDICSSWYHGDCVGIPEEEGKNVPEFICVACKPSSSSGTDNKSMCLCRQPYVETQFCIACEKCDEWFHGRCVGILPTEGDSIPAYFCPTCQPGMKINAINAKTLSDENYVEISKTLRQIQSHKSSHPFMNPVNAAEVPNYYKVIKEPMDLKTIALRVEEKMYSKLLDFVADLAKIIDNYRFFNPPESQIYKAGHLLEKFCSQKMGNLRSVLDKQ